MSSAVVDVVIAVVLTLALTALAASAVVEWIGNLTHKRAKYLLRGLRNMLDAAGDAGRTAKSGPLAGAEAENAIYRKALAPGDGTTGDLTARLFDHPMLRAMMQPRRSAAGERTRVPPYVPAEMFSRALVDTLTPDDGDPLTLDRVRAAVAALDESMPARKALLGLAVRPAPPGKPPTGPRVSAIWSPRRTAPGARSGGPTTARGVSSPVWACRVRSPVPVTGS
ncbi:hypothetical protein [Actinoplanes friuliensis]|uniref:Uncharacterized protein n=1 Tax=Actinoplanes friuliensis DSM 7358 TaxID=1246995 RepID=U5W1X4_9ACTN|nr:hypothetical protein [Actinoplanes friuliensis]AGZ41926.1 hypothetical protein AFR_18240 [Actinoplanes friuliensis DSM 7358]